MDLHEVVGSNVTPEGVNVLTVGHCISAQMRDFALAQLQSLSPEGYAEYRAIKYPDGKGSRTPETCRAALRHVFKCLGEICAEHYLTRPSANEEG